MQLVLLILLAIFLLVLVVLVTALWHRWTFYLHVYEEKFLLELRGFGFRRQLIFRDFGEKPKKEPPVESQTETPQKKAPQQEKLKKKRSGFSFSEHWAKTKKRIYDPEKGGYQSGGLGEVFREYKDVFHQFKDIILGFAGGIRQRIWITSLWIRLDYGTGDPAQTGMIYGSIWSGLGMAYPIACRYIRMVYPSLEITPDFYQPRFDLEVKSIIKVRPAHIIHALLKQLWRPAVTYCYHHITRKGSVAND